MTDEITKLFPGDTDVFGGRWEDEDVPVNQMSLEENAAAIRQFHLAKIKSGVSE